MRYSNVDYFVVYVDPSITTPGDGTTPETALANLPEFTSDFVSETCFIIRRTSEEYAVTIPAGTHNEMYNLMLIGMPYASDLMYEFIPEEAKIAWGADSEPYANMKSIKTNESFEMPNIRHFLLHRIYLFRDNINADKYIFYFYNRDEYKACISIEHCKFGSKGIDIDKADYAGGALASSRLKAYIYIHYARMLNIKDLTLNYAITGNTNDAYGIYCQFADILHVEDVRIYSPLSYTSYGYYAMYLSGNSNEGIECYIRNIKQYLTYNGTYEYIPSLIHLRGYLNVTIHDVFIELLTGLSQVRPTNLYIQNYLLYFANMYDFSVKNINVNIPDCWHCRSNVIRFDDCYTGNYVPGCVKEVKDITISLAEENGLGGNISFDDSQNSNYAALYLDFSDRDSEVYAKVPIVDNINISNIRGVAFYVYNARVTRTSLKGTMMCYYSIADIDLLESWFPGNVLWVYDGSHVRVKEVKVNLKNPTYLYNQEPAIGTDFNNRANVFVDKSNISLRPLSYLSDDDYYIYQGFTCNNEGETGHFCQRTPNGICDTWSVRRVGGGSAGLKLYNNNYNTMRTMVLGRRPFKGMQLLPNSAGRHMLKMYIAHKGYADDTDMYRRLIVSATIKNGNGDKTYFSTLHGRWINDDESLWVNDENLTQKCLEMPLDLPNSEAVDIRIYFAWYSGSGFVYIDPAVELIKTEVEE